VPAEILLNAVISLALVPIIFSHNSNGKYNYICIEKTRKTFKVTDPAETGDDSDDDVSGSGSCSDSDSDVWKNA